jgi:AcrR family transcriptional regulator
MARAASERTPVKSPRPRRAGPERILAAAFTCFSRYGYKRVSLEQIAQEAGVSRAALYLHFRNKEDLFRALARHLLEEAQAAVEVAAKEPAPAAVQLTRVLDAKYGLLFERIYGSPHAAEILDENSRQSGDLMEESRRRFQRTLRACLARADAAGEIDLRPAELDAGEAAELLAAAAKGLERAGPGEPDAARCRRRIAQLVDVFVRGLARRPVRRKLSR